ncbi:MAG: hypothetical protein J5I59_08765 [Saprospiraceae bacterium]|nr:hypothetical protein [Saprospiraceae bacterium]
MKKRSLLLIVCLIVFAYSFTMYIGMNENNYQSYLTQQKTEQSIVNNDENDVNVSIKVFVDFIDRMYRAVAMINRAAN